jgi:hypothetical protein
MLGTDLRGFHDERNQGAKHSWGRPQAQVRFKR